MSVTDLERNIYAQICSHNGIKAREIAKNLKADKTAVNRYLYASPFMSQLCYRDGDYLWHGRIRQTRPHHGLRDYCGYYSSVRDFMKMSEEDWFDSLLEGCVDIGRNINDTRGLFHSFKDARKTMIQCLRDCDGVDYDDWEIVFELRISKGRVIRIFADVLVITDNKVFSLEFKMKDSIQSEEVEQAAKYTEYLEVIFGPEYDVIPVLVLTKASDLYTYVPIGESTAEIPVCAGDMLFNVFDEYIGFLEDS